MILCSKPMEK